MQIGEAAGAEDEAAKLVGRMRARMRAVARAVAGSSHRSRVLVLTGADPLRLAASWVPDMLTLAGGHACLHQPGQPPPEPTWDQVLRPA